MIEEMATGMVFASEVLPASSEDFASLDGHWEFDWRLEGSRSKVYKLVRVDFRSEILGLMAIARESGYLEVRLLESSHENVGRGKRFSNIPGNLLATAAALSFRLGNDGYLKLKAKTDLIDHHIAAYGFMQFRSSSILILETDAAARLLARFPRRSG